MEAHPDTSECVVCNASVDVDAPRSIADLLGSLMVGDIFHASSTNGGNMICIVRNTDADSISGRRFTTGEDLVFSRTTGALVKDKLERLAWIDTVEPLPSAVHNTFIEMDRRYRLGKTFARVRLTAAEIEALSGMVDHVRTHAFRHVEINSGDAPGGGLPDADGVSLVDGA